MSRTLNTGIPFFWMGMVIAISFMEAPLKFQAPGITVELGLGIGRLVFFTLNKMELVLALILGFTIIGTGKKSSVRIYSFISFLLTIQTLWLLPVLDERAVLLLSGTTPEPAPYHTVYIVMEGLKIISLSLLGHLNLKNHE